MKLSYNDSNYACPSVLTWTTKAFFGILNFGSYFFCYFVGWFIIFPQNLEGDERILSGKYSEQIWMRLNEMY